MQTVPSSKAAASKGGLLELLRFQRIKVTPSVKPFTGVNSRFSPVLQLYTTPGSWIIYILYFYYFIFYVYKVDDVEQIYIRNKQTRFQTKNKQS